MYGLKFKQQKPNHYKRFKRYNDYLCDNREKLIEYYKNMPEELFLRKRKALKNKMKRADKLERSYQKYTLLNRNAIMMAAAFDRDPTGVFALKATGMTEEEIKDFFEELRSLYYSDPMPTEIRNKKSNKPQIH